MGSQKRNYVGARMKALFITPPIEAHELVSAWNSWNEPATHKTFNVWDEPDDESILQIVRDTTPDVIFYVGGNAGKGLPSFETFRDLRNLAPLIHLCWDATDVAWHATLAEYKKYECFNLQVAMDGGTDSPVDMATLTPCDPRPYERNSDVRNIRCAFAGQNVNRAFNPIDQHPRWNILMPLVKMKLVKFRRRGAGPYSDYVAYIKSCQILLNISHTGSGRSHHVKVRVIEAGLAGCALLEMRQAPTHKWIPKELLFQYRNIKEAAEIIRSAEIEDKASALSTYVRENYSPQRIYESILARL